MHHLFCIGKILLDLMKTILYWFKNNFISQQASREPKPESSQKFYGPVLPTSLKSASAVQDEDDSSDDDELIGPLPPKPGEEISTQEALARQFEERAKKMKDKIDGKDVQAPPKRETW